jgi:PAS domain S-box-containing protein
VVSERPVDLAPGEIRRVVLEGLLEGNADPVFSVDSAYCYTSFNAAHAHVMRALYGAEIALGQSLLECQTVEADREAAREHIDRALGGETLTEEAYSGEDTRTRHFFSVTHAPLRHDGAVVGVLVQARDITERRRAERDLRESEEKFRYIFDFSPLGKSITLPSGEIHVNQAFCDMVGYSREELERAHWQDITHPDDVDATQRRLEPLLAGAGDQVRFEKRYVHKDGSIVWADVATSLRRDDAGRPLYFVTAVTDITPRVIARESLADSERRYRELVDHMSSGVVVYEPTPDGRDFIIREFNTASQRIEQVTRDAVVGRRVTDAFPGVEQFGLLDVFRRVASTGEPEEFPTALYTDDRLASWRENYVYRLPSGEVVAVYDDVTERVEAERSAQRAKDLLERAEELSHLGGWEYDLALGKLTWTSEVYRIHGLDLGFDPGDIDRDLTFYPPESAPVIAEAYRRALETGEPYDLELELDRADGRRIWVRTVGRPVMENGSVVRVVGNIMDITERKRTEQALRESEHRLRRFYEAGIVGVIYWTMDGEIVDANDRFLEMVGYTREELEAGRVDWRHMTPPEFAYLDERSIEELKARGANAVPFEKEYIRKDGSRMPIIVAGAMLDEECYNGVALVLDTTEKKAAEEALRHLNAELEQRVHERTTQLESANRELEAFAYSVSHDLRAPLRHISAYAGILASQAEEVLDDDSRQCLDNISSSVRDMGELIDDLLQFSRIGRAEMRIGDVDMDRALAEALAPLQEESRGRTVEWVIHPLPHVAGDPVLLRQVWANLLDNALKYSRGREEARIEVGAFGRPGEDVFYVRDNGVGFDMQFAHKLFGVFQRLHDPSEFEGTGIGLASARRIIDRLGGRTWAEAEPDKGATFFFALPRREASP